MMDIDKHCDIHILVDALKICHNLVGSHRIEGCNGSSAKIDHGNLPFHKRAMILYAIPIIA